MMVLPNINTQSFPYYGIRFRIGFEIGSLNLIFQPLTSLSLSQSHSLSRSANRYEGVICYLIAGIRGDPEVTANLYCDFGYPYWEGCVICSTYSR